MSHYTSKELDSLADRIVDHSWNKHVVIGDEFSKSEFGRPLEINEPSDLRTHFFNTLNDPETKGAVIGVDGRKAYFFNQSSNTFIAIDPNLPDGGTIFRQENPDFSLKQFLEDSELAKRGYDPDARITSGGLDGVSSAYAEQYPDRAASAQKISGILSDPETIGFASTGSKNKPFYQFSESERAIVTLESGRAQIEVFDDIEEAKPAFGKTRDQVAVEHRPAHGGLSPILRGGGHDGLIHAVEQMKIHGPQVNLPDDVSAKTAGIGSKIAGGAKGLAYIGGGALLYDAHLKDAKAQELHEFGQLSNDALSGYRQVLSTYVGQGLKDPTTVIGEFGVEKAFDQWADKHDVPAHIQKDLDLGLVIDAVREHRDRMNGELEQDIRDFQNALKESAGIETERDIQERHDPDYVKPRTGWDTYLNPLPGNSPRPISYSPEADIPAPAAPQLIPLRTVVEQFIHDRAAMNAGEGGEIGVPGQDVDNIARIANHAHSETLFNQLHEHGIETLTIDPIANDTPSGRVYDTLRSALEATHEAELPEPGREDAVIEPTPDPMRTHDLHLQHNRAVSDEYDNSYAI